MRSWCGVLVSVLTGAVLLSGCTRYTPAQPENMSQEGTDGVTESDATEETVTSSAAEDILSIRDEDSEAYPERTPVKVKGIYLSAYTAGNEETVDSIIERIDETELNAVVIDFKTDEGYIAAEVDSELLKEVGACRNYIPDLPGLMEKLERHGIYTIARVVAFKDPYLAEQRPEWSLKTGDGSLYRDKQGLAWVNPYSTEVWDYLVETGTQAAMAGFDEIQFDYIRFSTDSTMRQVVFDENQTLGRSRTDIITEFTQYAYGKLRPLGVFVSADVFGAVIGSEQDARAVGQNYGDMACHVDYICPMIYPSHYGDGNFGLDHPDLYPYETVLRALQKSSSELAEYGAGKATDSEILTRPRAVVRPWLQDFTATYLKNHKTYKDDEIREQIQAVYDAGYEEWILWNAANDYHYGGLLDE